MIQTVLRTYDSEYWMKMRFFIVSESSPMFSLPLLEREETLMDAPRKKGERKGERGEREGGIERGEEERERTKERVSPTPTEFSSLCLARRKGKVKR